MGKMYNLTIIKNCIQFCLCIFVFFPCLMATKARKATVSVMCFVLCSETGLITIRWSMLAGDLNPA